MAGHVYHTFGPDDLYETRVHAQPTVTAISGASGWTGNIVSLYGGIRGRSDTVSGSALQLYPLDWTETHTIDGYVQVPGTYPMTASIEFVTCTDTAPALLSDITPRRWYEEHYRPLQQLCAWHHDHTNALFPAILTGTIYVFHIPSMFYGREIVRGSVRITDWSVGDNGTIYVDDGHGILIVSGTDVTAPKGYVFYREGFVVTPLQLGSTGQASGSAVLGIEFKGSSVINSKVMMCRLAPGEANASNNPTYFTTGTDGRRYARTNTTYITAVGIYNEERELVAVAKLAQPIRKRERDQIDIRLKIDL